MKNDDDTHRECACSVPKLTVRDDNLLANYSTLNAVTVNQTCYDSHLINNNHSPRWSHSSDWSHNPQISRRRLNNKHHQSRSRIQWHSLTLHKHILYSGGGIDETHRCGRSTPDFYCHKWTAAESVGCTYYSECIKCSQLCCVYDWMCCAREIYALMGQLLSCNLVIMISCYWQFIYLYVVLLDIWGVYVTLKHCNYRRAHRRK